MAAIFLCDAPQVKRVIDLKVRLLVVLKVILLQIEFIQEHFEDASGDGRDE